MKKLLFLFIAINFACVSVFAQDIEITFAAEGAATTIESVTVENITKGTSITLTGTDVLVLTTPTSITSIKKNESIQIIPNPIGDEGEIRFYTPVSGITKINIVDVKGRIVVQQNNNLEAGINSYLISGLQLGVYYASVVGQGYSYTASIVSNANSTTKTNLNQNSLTVSKNEIVLKSSKSRVLMDFTTGDSLKFTGTSKTLSAIVTDIPTASKTIVFTFTSEPTVVEVINPTTGKTWMDRNLGASQVATSSTDEAAYGDLYQWGRGNDEHQVRTSATISLRSNSDTTEHGDFITTSSLVNDWRNPQNDSLWQGVNGTNNPCPSGYRLPTIDEWEAEIQSWSSNDPAGAFASPLKLPTAGYRDFGNGALAAVDSKGYYWSSSVDEKKSQYLYLYSGGVYTNSGYRANGFSVRCIKD